MKTFAVLCMLFGFFSNSPAFAGQPEMLLGLTTDFEAKTIIFEVAGSGCTGKDSFRPEFRNGVLTIYRIKPDACKAMPSRAKFTYSLEEVGINPHHPFRIGNSFIVNENLADM